MKISKAIELLAELRSSIGDAYILTGDNERLKEDDFSVLIRQTKSGHEFYSVGIKMEIK